MIMSRMLTTAGLAALLLAASAPPIAAADPTVTLRLATPESEDRPSEAFLQAFKNAVATASDGSMAVDITYRAGGDDFDPKELNVAHRVMSGEVELAVVPVRTWNDAGVTSFQALSAPLLIDDDALAVAVTTDPLVQPMLDGAAAQGLVGLTLWPEDLRHPFTFVQNGPALLAPDDFMGANIWALPSQLQTEILGALGATAVNTGTADAGVADGTLRGAESGMWQGIYTLGGGMPTATGDITLYPKFQVLVAEDAAWSRLPAAQQAIVRDAATTARDAYLAQRPDDIANGSAYCAAGGTIVDAGSANREA
jgi:TRAP-type C4-dicarboxylate transport system substrate-binding protein